MTAIRYNIQDGLARRSEKRVLPTRLTVAQMGISTRVGAMNSDLRNKRVRLSEPFYWTEQVETATGRAFLWHCPFCNADLQLTGYHKAHISPAGTGIGLVPGNVVLACPRCNQRMNRKHAWDYCAQQGIDPAPIKFTLEIIARIFPVAEIEEAFKAGRGTLPRDIARTFFQDNPDVLSDDGADLVSLAAQLGIGKSTLYAVRNKMRAESIGGVQ